MQSTHVRAALGAALAATALAEAAPAHAEVKVFKYDQFSANIAEAATQLSGIPLAVQPGFAAGEAYGQLYWPDPTDFPLKIVGIDLVLAAPPNAPNLTTKARIEIWNDDGIGVMPSGNTPLFAITTEDLYNGATGSLGIPLQGNTALSIDFDPADPDNSPPIITGGRIWVMIRFTEAPESLLAEWGSAQCLALPELGACGCQKVGVVADQVSSKNANIINHIAPLGTCFGAANSWQYAEQMGVVGDFVLRMRADVPGGCVPDCSQKECGPDGCGGSCGTCGVGSACKADGTCSAPVCSPSCSGKECGSDGCGGVCGTCVGNTECTNFQCEPVPCDPDCTGKECGSDGCGGQCGTCEAPATCDFGQCIEPCAPQCAGKECGPDGCGSTCGACEASAECTPEGLCSEEGEEPCDDPCGKRICGNNACGTSCGTCEAGQECVEGMCVAPPLGLTVTAISPNFGSSGAETPVSITGSGFVPGMTVKLGGTNLNAVQTIGDSLITATVPAGLAPGVYLLVVITPSATTATLADAYEVRESLGASCGDGSCDSPESCESCPDDCGACEGSDENGEGGQATGDGGDAGGEPSGASSGGCNGLPNEPGLPISVGLVLLALAAYRPKTR